MSIRITSRRASAPARVLAAAFLLLFLLAQPASARDRRGFEIAPPPSLPEPNPLRVEVRQGEEVQIALSAFSLTSPIVRYRIREKPRMGTLAPSPYVDGKTGLVTYRPRPGAGAGEDEFTYSVQSEAGVSAPAEVKIKILDTDPILAVPLEVQFGDVVFGTSARQMITLENVGGGTAEGTVQPPEGYHVEGSADYRLLGGMKQDFTIAFAPAAETAYDGVIQYTGNPDHATDVKGNGAMPVQVGATHVEMDLLGLQRFGSVWLRNRTAAAQTVRIEGGARLSATEALVVPPNGVANIELHTALGDFAPVRETLAFGGAAHGEVAITAPAVPAKLEAHLAGAGPGGTMQVALENHGGPAQVTVRAIGDFIVPASNSAFRLGSEETRTIVAQPNPLSAAAGALSGHLIAQAGESRAEVSLSGTAAAALPPAPVFTAAAAGVYQPPGVAVPMASDPDEPLPTIYTRALIVQSVSRQDAVVKWVPGLDAPKWQLEAGVLSVNDTVRTVWQPFLAAEFKREGDAVVAHVGYLDPGSFYRLRMRALDANNRTLATSGVAEVLTASEPKGSRNFWYILGALALGGFGYWRWRVRRRAAE